MSISIGDIVRVKTPDLFVAKYRDREGLVQRVGPDEIGQFKGKAFVKFLKRNGRGKEWEIWMRITDLVKVES